MAYDSNNIFARILRGELPATKVYEDEAAVAFLDLFPQSKGHTLVIPKTAAENFFDIPPSALADLIQKTQRVAHAVRKALKPDGVTIIQFNGAAAGQTVYHIHFHIIPRWDGVPLKGHGTAPKADAAELAALAETIKAGF